MFFYFGTLLMFLLFFFFRDAFWTWVLTSGDWKFQISEFKGCFFVLERLLVFLLFIFFSLETLLLAFSVSIFCSLKYSQFWSLGFNHPFLWNFAYNLWDLIILSFGISILIFGVNLPWLWNFDFDLCDLITLSFGILILIFRI